jgi:uncharacterized protein (TIGR02266 family)
LKLHKTEIPIAVLMQYFRVPTGDLPVDYPGREVLLGSRVTNISTTGAFIRTGNPLPKGSELDLLFTLPGTKEPLEIHAVVRWSSAVDLAEKPDPAAPTGMGVQFMKVSRKHRKIINRFVEEFLSRMRQGT